MKSVPSYRDNKSVPFRSYFNKNIPWASSLLGLDVVLAVAALVIVVVVQVVVGWRGSLRVTGVVLVVVDGDGGWR